MWKLNIPAWLAFESWLKLKWYKVRMFFIAYAEFKSVKKAFEYIEFFEHEVFKEWEKLGIIYRED
jgi:hypothetical protein